ncbi:MAG: MATE family efflux transporter [Oscillospiraceae bacterium]
MSWIIKDKKFYKDIAIIAIPVALQNIISLSVNMIDTLMIGQLGDVQLAASSVANNIFFFFFGLVFGISGGANILAAQYWGKKDSATIRKVMSLAHKCVFVLAIFFTLAASLFPTQILSIFSEDPEVIMYAAKYLKIVCYSYMAIGLGNCTMFMFRSVGSVNMTLFIYTTSLITNGFLNWVLIFGKLGAPALGIEGAAYATLIARIQEIIIIIIYTFFIDKKIQYKLKDFLSFDTTIIKDFFATASVVVCNEFLWSSGSTMISIIIGRLSTDFVAANSISSLVSQLVSVMIFGVASAAAALVGNTIGRGEYDRAKQMAKTLMVLALGVGIIASVMTLIARPIVLSLYSNLSEITLHYAYDLIGISSIVVIFQAIAGVNMMGTLRGGGDAKFVLFADIIFMWILAIPLGFLSAFYFHFSIPLVYLVIRSDEFLKTIICALRIKSEKWVKDITL